MQEGSGNTGPYTLSVLTDVIGPVLLIAAAGYLLSRASAVDTRALTSLAAYILVPALPSLVSSTVVITTLLSPLTITPLLVLLR